MNKILPFIMGIIIIIYTIGFVLDEKTIEVSYEPKTELKTLVQNINYTNIPKDVTSEAAKADEKVVYDGLTLNELAEKLEKSLNDDLKGYGYKFASYALELGLDPYLCLGIVLEETGCSWECSRLVKQCNNIGGQKGSGCGAYQSFSSLDEGIEKFLDNIYKNYFKYGLTTAVEMNPKYAENPLWATNVNAHIQRIKSK